MENKELKSKKENIFKRLFDYSLPIEYIKSDYCRYYGTSNVSMLKITVCTFKSPYLAYSYWFRLSKKKGIFYLYCLYKLSRTKRHTGIQIPPNTKIGYGLYIGHGCGTILNPTTVIGDNCNLSQFSTIGSNHGQAATIGDNVYIGPSVCIVENVHIGNNVSIGAGAVVTKDIPDNATVAGVPAKVLNYNNPGRYITKRYVRKH